MPSSKNDPVRLRAFAKLNLSLKVTGRRPDGFHDIDSIMQSVSLHDEVEVKAAASGITVKCDPSIDDNIAGLAARTLLEDIKLVKGVEISLKKHIPVASGLAGGSADAAAVLIGMNKALGLNLHRNKLMGIAEKIGSDVPFCLTGGTCRVTGRGEKVERIDPVSGGFFLLVFPKLNKSTKDVYARFDATGAGRVSSNDLEAAAVSIEPELGKIKASLVSATGGDWRMSGAGPTLFLALGDISESERYTDKIAELGLSYRTVKRMDAGVEMIALSS